jgi:predicted GIY-YIG superfamily endonuclease
VNSQSEAHRLRTMTQAAFPFRMCDVTLPQCRTGFVYMLMSIKRQNYTYIGQTICIRTRIQQHNSGYGSTSTQPAYLRPFALLAYICGFGNRRILREHVEYQWKLKRDHMIRNGINDAKRWAQCGQDVINEITLQDYTIAPSDLTLVLLYQHDDE